MGTVEQVSIISYRILEPRHYGVAYDYKMGQMLSGMWGEPEHENPAPPVEASPARTPDTTRKPDPLIRRPIPEGSMVYMQKQDPSVKSIGYRTVWVSTRMWSGPRSDRIEIKGMDRVFPSDSSNNYLYSPYSKPEEFDAVNAFAVINHVHQMYERALKRMDHTRELRWNWGAGPIKVFPRAGDWANAFYSRDEKALAFFYFKDKNGRSDDIIYTGRSFDIMSHEAGHAILDSLKPHYITSKNPQCGALHESFGDLTAIFALLESLDMCEAIIAYSKCDLHSTGWFATIGEEFGTGLGLPMGLRNSDNNLKIDQVTEEVHDLSRVFTGAVFDSLVDIFEVTRNIEKYDPAETLYRVGKHVSAITLIGFLKGPDTNADFRDIAESMMAVETEPVYKEIMKKQFNRRKIFDWSASPRPFNAAAAAPIHTLCGTMQLHNEPEPADSTDSPIRNDMRVRLSTYLNASEASHPPPLPDDTRDATDGPRRPTDIIPLVPTDQPMPDVPNGGEEQHPI